MSFPTIDKFDINFVKRTIQNLDNLKEEYKFTHLINSLVGLIFIPNEFNKKGNRTYKIDFLNKPISNYTELYNIFTGDFTYKDKDGKDSTQQKFFRKGKDGNSILIEKTSVGDLVRLFRNGIAHSNITPVADGDSWKGIIVKNFETRGKEKEGDFNFMSYLTQKELLTFSTFIAVNYLNNIHE